MTSPKKLGLQSVATVMLFVAIVWVATGWAFARFVHYHSQNCLLSPVDYEAEVVSATDHARLSDANAMSVRLSDGRKVHKTEIWHSVVLPNYKPIDGGDRYVLVTVKGTAPFLPALEATLVPVFIVLLIALVCAIRPLMRSASEQKEEAA
ncbi:MAG: hypothetical protein HN742_02485 [Lentisphaerae bacterium]|jgi:hypothetical protein|nr:hypothetical protein [Lentisphaerota bacterium]MBT5610923.1 hypothetical protein [Lentisphaerota bacterium]MBT7053436.1 hypothetical protein [Lentisphaerota bacterium]MBT7840706.1 hypothetical protein [Lentisphaerota bacterium]